MWPCVVCSWQSCQISPKLIEFLRIGYVSVECDNITEVRDRFRWTVLLVVCHPSSGSGVKARWEDNQVPRSLTRRAASDWRLLPCFVPRNLEAANDLFIYSRRWDAWTSNRKTPLYMNENFRGNFFFPVQLAFQELKFQRQRDKWNLLKSVVVNRTGIAWLSLLSCTRCRRSVQWTLDRTLDCWSDANLPSCWQWQFVQPETSKVINFLKNNLKFVCLNGMLLSTFSAEFVTHLSPI